MEQDENNVICRLCLKECQDFEAIEESHREMLDTLQLNHNLSVSHDPVICKTCTDTLSNCFAYKTKSLHMKAHLSKDNFCLFCQKKASGSHRISLKSSKLEVILLTTSMQQFFPELDLRRFLNPKLCPQCFGNLQKNFDFLVQSLNIEQQIEKYCETAGCNTIDLFDIKNLQTGINEHSNEIHIPHIKTEDKSIIELTENSVQYLPIKNENDETINSAIKIEETWKNKFYHNDKNITQNTTKQIKLEENCVKEKVDTVRETIEAVVRKYSCHDDITTKTSEYLNVEKTKGKIIADKRQDAKRRKQCI